MSEQADQQSLMLGDRINWPFILANAVLKFHEAIVREEGAQSEQQVREAALTLRQSIPDAWIKADEQFKKDLENATITVKVDKRKIFMGRPVGKPKIEDEDDLDPYRLYHACVNVFQRRGLLSKTIFTEKIVPEPEDFEETDPNSK